MKTAISRLVVSFLLAMAAFLPSEVSEATTLPAKIVEPSPTNFQSWTFSPGTLTVHVGDTVTWTNTGQANHTVTANGGAFDSGNVAPAAAFSFAFTKPGTYAYQCGYHPWMKGTVVVLAAGQAAATPIPPTATARPATPTPMPPFPTSAPQTATTRPTTVKLTAAPTATPRSVATQPTAVPASPTVAPTATLESALPTVATALASATSAPSAVTPVATTPSAPPLPSPSAPPAATETVSQSSDSVNTATLGWGLVGLLILAAVGITLGRRRG